MRDLKSSVFRGIAILLLLAAAILFCIAMVETAYVTTQQPIQGYWIFLIGWMGFLIFQFAWYANPLTLLAVLLMRKHPWWALLASTLALLCMSQAFLFNEIPTDASGNTIAILARKNGFYSWIAMIICVFYADIMVLIYRAFDRDVEQSDVHKTPSSILITKETLLPAETSYKQPPLSFPNGAISTRSNP